MKKGSTAQRMRQARLTLFHDLIRDLPEPVNVLDVGGTHHFWLAIDRSVLPRMRITFVNKWAYQPDLPDVVAVVGDARDLSRYADREFDAVFSNSVVEHVGILRDQELMAHECVRVGKRYFVQTPNWAFPLEPHFLFPGFQYLPLAVRARLHHWRRLGWWDKAPSYSERARRGRVDPPAHQARARLPLPERDHLDGAAVRNAEVVRRLRPQSGERRAGCCAGAVGETRQLSGEAREERARDHAVPLHGVVVVPAIVSRQPA